MSDVLGPVVGSLTALTLAGAILGAAVRYVLLPWLREHLVKPVQETRHQVAVNAHASPVPTVLDRLDSLAAQLEEVRTSLAVTAALFDRHLSDSAASHRRLWKHVTGKDTPL